MNQGVCLAHKDPNFSPPIDFLMITTGCSRYSNAIAISDDELGEGFAGRSLSEYLQLFYLIQNPWGLDQCDNFINFFQYRKFLSVYPGLTNSVNMPYAKVVSGRLAADTFIKDKIGLSPKQGDLFCGPILSGFRSVAEAYSKYHLVEDYCLFCASLKEVEGFTGARIKSFVYEKFFIPSPTVSIISKDDIIDIAITLHSAWNVFKHNYFVDRSGYQRRVGGFLLERLHSFLVIERARVGKINLRPLQLAVVSESDTVVPT